MEDFDLRKERNSIAHPWEYTADHPNGEVQPGSSRTANQSDAGQDGFDVSLQSDPYSPSASRQTDHSGQSSRNAAPIDQENSRSSFPRLNRRDVPL